MRRRRIHPEMGNALAIERVERIETRGVGLLAFAAQRLGRVPILSAVAGEKLAMALRKKDEVLRLLDRAVAKKPEDPRRLGLAFHFEEIDFEKGEVGSSRRGGFADHGADVIGLRLSLEP